MVTGPGVEILQLIVNVAFGHLCTDTEMNSGVTRVCNRLSGYSGYSDIRKNLSVRIAI